MRLQAGEGHIGLAILIESRHQVVPAPLVRAVVVGTRSDNFSVLLHLYSVVFTAKFQSNTRLARIAKVLIERSIGQ